MIHDSWFIIHQLIMKAIPYSTPQAIPRSPTMKGIPTYSLLVEVARGVFQRCVETTLFINSSEKTIVKAGIFPK